MSLTRAKAGMITYKNDGTGAVVRTLKDKLGETVSVKDFGAVGDGVTDDTAAIQAAIDYAESNIDPATHGSYTPYLGSLVVQFDAGVYRLSDELIISKSISINGHGHSEFSTGTRILQYTANKDHFKVVPIAQGCSVSFDHLTMTAIGNGGTSGSCINITKTTANCNSLRIQNCTFGTPQSLAIKIQSSNDVMIDNNLFDVSAVSSIGLGTSSATDTVSNCQILGNTFYAIDNFAVLLYNVDGCIISSNRLYPNVGNTNTFVDGFNTLPFQIKNVIVSNNQIDSCDCLVHATGVNGFLISNNVCEALGAGVGATLSGIKFTGASEKINISGNIISGNFDTHHVFENSGTITKSYIGSNTFEATGGSGQALSLGVFSGGVDQSSFTSYSLPSMGEKWFTSGNAVSVGVIGSLGSATHSETVTGVSQGDTVKISPSSTVWFAPDGIVVTAYVSAPNTVTIKYSNPTASAIGVGAHDVGILVTR